MFATTTMIRPAVAAMAGAFLFAGCATGPDGSFRLDDRLTGALLGAGIGCTAAEMTGGKCGKGAAIGAVAGFLIGWYFESRKVASATQVNTEYRQKGVVVPPSEIKPAAFTTRVRQAPVDREGKKEIQVTSNTDMIGYGDRTPEMAQKYAIYDEKNHLVEEKTEKIAAADGAGRYQTNSKFKVQAPPPGKSYTVKTTLVVDDQPYQENSYKVSFGEGVATLLAMSE